MTVWWPSVKPIKLIECRAERSFPGLQSLPIYEGITEHEDRTKGLGNSAVVFIYGQKQGLNICDHSITKLVHRSFIA